MWSQLPTELWLDILAEFTQKDLVAFNQTCKQLHQLTEPLLYSKLSWLPESKRDLSSALVTLFFKSSTKIPTKIHLLLKTLLNRPELALHFKSAEFMSPLSTNGEAKNILPFWSPKSKVYGGFTSRDFELAKTLIQGMGFSDPDEWLENLQKGRSDVIIALILSQLSEIRSLDIRLRTYHYQPPIVGGTILEALNTDFLTSGPLRLRNLESISLSVDRDERGFQASIGRMAHLYRFDSQVAPLFRIKSLKKLELAWIHPEFPMGPSPIPVTQNLTTLIIRDSIINEDVLGVLLRGTPRLEVLECQLTYDHFRSERCDCEVLRTALDLVAASLTALMIGMQVIWEAPLADDWSLILGSMTSMMNFQNLKHLAIPLIMLVGSSNTQLVEVLPKQLETFEVGWSDSRQTIKHIEGQIEEYINEATMLHAVKVDTSRGWSQNFKNKLSGLPGNKVGGIGTNHQLRPVLI